MFWCQIKTIALYQNKSWICIVIAISKNEVYNLILIFLEFTKKVKIDLPGSFNWQGSSAYVHMGILVIKYNIFTSYTIFLEIKLIRL